MRSSTSNPTEPEATAGRRRTAAVIAVWALLPAALGSNAAAIPRVVSAVVFGAFAIGALAAAALAYSVRRVNQNAAVAVLTAMWIPCAVVTAWQFVLSFGVRLLDVASSPVAFLLGVFVESLFVATLPVFAVSVWRRRSGSPRAGASLDTAD